MDKLIISDDFKNILECIKHNSVIAKCLLMPLPTSELVDDDKHIDYVSISSTDPNKISYLSAARIDVVERKGISYWDVGHRFHTKYGAFINKLFKPNTFNNREIEIFSNILKSSFNQIFKDEFNFSVVDGTQITNYYHQGNYASAKDDCNSLYNSCMKYDKCQEYFGLYTKNPENISMLVLLNQNSKLVGRALLWNFENYKIMDRIYTIQEEFEFTFKKWANDNGYYHKKIQNFKNTSQFVLNGVDVDLELSLKLKHFEYKRYPYLDSFKWLSDDGTIYNYLPDNFRGKTISDHEGGFYEYDMLGKDSFENCYYYNNDLVNLPYIGKNYKTNIKNTRSSDVNKCNIINEDAFYVNFLDDFIFNAKFEYLNNFDEIKNRVNKSINSHYEQFSSYEKERISDEAYDHIISYKEYILPQLGPFSKMEKRKSTIIGSVQDEIVTQLGSRLINFDTDTIPVFNFDTDTSAINSELEIITERQGQTGV